MLALDYYVCPDCETVFATLDAVERCGVCGESTVERLAPEGTAAAYFDARTHREDATPDVDGTDA